MKRFMGFIVAAMLTIPFVAFTYLHRPIQAQAQAHASAQVSVIHTSHGDFPVKRVAKIEEKDCPKCVTVGITYFESRSIEIVDRLTDCEERETLLHESLHAELGQEWTDEQVTGHEAIYRMAPAVLNLLKRNPELAAHLEQ